MLSVDTGIVVSICITKLKQVRVILLLPISTNEFVCSRIDDSALEAVPDKQ